MARRVFEITKSVTFEAAHRLASAPGEAGAQIGYDRVHGHSFLLEASLAGPRDAQKGWVEDMAALAAALEALRGELDHRMLNEIEGLETPTLEGICAWAAARLVRRFPQLSRVGCSRPSLHERCELRIG